MKNKKITYVLLPLAILIWGVIIYKIFFYRNTKENNITVFHSNSAAQTPQMKTDTFTLLLNYQDPFLKNTTRTNISYQQNEKSQPVKKVPKIPQPEEKAIVFPPLKYEGLIKHISQGKALVIVNVNGKSKFVQTGETFDDMKLVKVYNDSIIVSYEKQNKTFRKQ